MAQPEREQSREKLKRYAVFVAVGGLFIILLGAETFISIWALNLSFNADLIYAIKGFTNGNVQIIAWSLISAIVIALNGVLCILAYPEFKKLFREHDTKAQEHFKPKIWPIVAMGFLIALAFGIMTSIVVETKTSLKGLDPISIYNALSSGHITGYMAILVALPIVGYVVIRLGPRGYHFMEDFEKKYHIPDIPEKKEHQDNSEEPPK